jgi:hypothetical protein
MRPILVSLLAICGLIPVVSPAHHTYAEYDQQKTVEIEGTLVKAAWQNPHLSLKVQVAGKDQQVVTWSIEGATVNGLRRVKARLVRKAGVMSVVLSGGDVRPLDQIRIERPAKPYRPLSPV